MFSYDQYNTIFFIGIMLAGFFLILSVVLFFVLKIPAVIGYLSGSTAKKEIAEIESGTKKRTRVQLNADSPKTKVTEKMPDTAKMGKPDEETYIRGTTTASLSKELSNHQSSNKKFQEEQTSVLVTDSEASDIRQSEGTIVADTEYAEQTSVLDEGTSVLYSNIGKDVNFSVRTEIVLFVSNEVIA